MPMDARDGRVLNEERAERVRRGEKDIGQTGEEYKDHFFTAIGEITSQA